MLLATSSKDFVYPSECLVLVLLKVVVFQFGEVLWLIIVFLWSKFDYFVSCPHPIKPSSQLRRACQSYRCEVFLLRRIIVQSTPKTAFLASRSTNLVVWVHFVVWQLTRYTYRVLVWLTAIVEVFISLINPKQV